MKIAAKGWLDSAKMDLDNIEYIIEQTHLTPVVAFHSHQAVEKLFKAVLEEKHADVPKTHDLIFLHKKLTKLMELELDKKILKRLNELYIDARYPGDLGLLPEGKPTLVVAREFYDFAKDIYQQVEQTLAGAGEKENESQKLTGD